MYLHMRDLLNEVRARGGRSLSSRPLPSVGDWNLLTAPRGFRLQPLVSLELEVRVDEVRPSAAHGKIQHLEYQDSTSFSVLIK